METIFSCVTPGTYYAVINNELNEVDITKVIYREDNKELVYVANSAIGCIELERNVKLYRATEDYKKGNAASENRSINANDVSTCIEASWSQDKDFTTWILDAGEPKEVCVTIDSIVIGNGGAIIDVKHDYKGVKHYATRQDLIDNNDIVVRDLDGSTKTIRGYKKALSLTQTQMDLVDKFKALLEEMKANNMLLYPNYEYGVLRAINAENIDIKDSETLDCRSDIEDWEESHKDNTCIVGCNDFVGAKLFGWDEIDKFYSNYDAKLCIQFKG